MDKIEEFLIALRRAGRRTILIVDADCGDGRRLIEIATRARELGFRVIDARGFDASPQRIAAAAMAAAAHTDPAIDFDFAVLDRHASLVPNAGDDGQADLLLTASGRPVVDLVDAMDRDGLLIRHWGTP